MPKYHAKRGKLYLSSTLAGAAVKVANLTKWALNITADKVDVTALGDDFKSFVRGVKSGTLKASGFWADDSDIPYDAFDGDTLVYAYLYPSENAPGKFWCGYVWPDTVTCDVDISGAVGTSIDATFDGSIGRTG